MFLVRQPHKLQKKYLINNFVNRCRSLHNMSTVKVKQGILNGVVCKSNSSTYFAYKGIPYAKPPIGELRFKAPEPPEPWDGIRDATEHGPVCPQFNERLQCIETGNEDCLYLNVYSKTLTPTRPLPVMVWIHGGSFYTGSGNSDYYGPEFFMKHDMILVTINYRLEVLGFLCLDTEEVPGNAGLKDQVAALRWVKENIAEFGGDENNITIFGCSAGSASCSYHLLSKMSTGLFNKAICQSGVCLNEWANNIYARQRAFQLGRLLGKYTNDTTELLEFLRSVPVSKLISINLPPIETNHRDITDKIFFSPVIENPALKIEKFISEQPIDLLRKGTLNKVPIIVGYTSGEGIEIVRGLLRNVDLLSSIDGVIPRELKFKLNDAQLKNVDKKVRNFYFKGEKFNEGMIHEVANLETDKLFQYNIHRFARYFGHHSSLPVYMYKMTVETERNYTKTNYKMDFLPGVCHADDLPYLFNITRLNIPLTKESTSVIEQFVLLWYNFASTGNPTVSGVPVQWKQFTDDERHCFIIGKEFKCIVNDKAEQMFFWENIYDEIRLKIEN